MDEDFTRFNGYEWAEYLRNLSVSAPFPTAALEALTAWCNEAQSWMYEAVERENYE